MFQNAVDASQKSQNQKIIKRGKKIRVGDAAVKLIYDLYAYSKENQLIVWLAVHLIRIYCFSLDVKASRLALML